MTFSPEDAYASSVPVPDDKKFDTTGLELVPLDGEETPEEAVPATEEVYTQEQQAADAERYSVAEKPVEVGGEEVAETAVETEPVAAEEQEVSRADAVKLANKILDLYSKANYGESQSKSPAWEEAVNNITEAEMSAIIKMSAETVNAPYGIGSGRIEISQPEKYGQRASEILSSPEVTAAVIKRISEGGVHVEELSNLAKKNSLSREIFINSEVKKGAMESIKKRVSNTNSGNWPYESGSVTNVIKEFGLDNNDLREIAEDVKATQGYELFLKSVGVERVYPELRS